MFKCRDGIAFLELYAALAPHGWAYAESVIMLPDDRRGLKEGYPEFRPSDLIVLTTRPPLDDEATHAPRKLIMRNHGPLEREIFDTVARKYFAFCSRKVVKLTPHAQSHLAPGADRERWSEVEYFENHQTGQKIDGHGAPPVRRHWAAIVKSHKIRPDFHARPAADRPSTAAYLVRDRLPSLGCDVLVSFGMDGDCTLIWNHLIRSQHPEWTLRRGFVMAELILPARAPDPARPPITISSLAGHVKLKVLAAGPTQE
jgi:hypothetical protein